MRVFDVVDSEPRGSGQTLKGCVFHFDIRAILNLYLSCRVGILDLCGRLLGRTPSMEISLRRARMMARSSSGRSRVPLAGPRSRSTPFMPLLVRPTCPILYIMFSREKRSQLCILGSPRAWRHPCLRVIGRQDLGLDLQECVVYHQYLFSDTYIAPSQMTVNGVPTSLKPTPSAATLYPGPPPPVPGHSLHLHPPPHRTSRPCARHPSSALLAQDATMSSKFGLSMKRTRRGSRRTCWRATRTG